MNYNEFLQEQMKSSEGLGKIVEIFSKIKGEKVLLFPHDDPDGLTSGMIIENLLKSKGASVRTVILPTYELSRKELLSHLNDEKFVVIVDKGTIGYYSDYTDLAEIIVIDHHPPQGGEIKKAIVFNPSVKNYTQTSSSHLTHIISSLCGVRDDKTDYLALLGMKADWAIEPATDMVCEYGSPFFSEVSSKYPDLLKKIKGSPTMFEVRQKEFTTLLNQIGEFYFVISGGGFQYFYENRQQEFAYKVLLDSPYKNWKNFEEFIDSLSQKEKCRSIYDKFRTDWKTLDKVFDYSLFIKSVGDEKTYLFVGRNVMWLPMAGSVKLYDFKKKESDSDVALIMVNQEASGGVHFSFRSTGGKLHLGRFASDLAEALIAKYGQRGIISGGGHPVAAECKTRTSGVPIDEALKIFLDMLNKY